jgi:uracil-DNA glycosylase
VTWEDLIADVFACTHCEGTGLPFTRASDGKFYRFPPIIGATGTAPLLFVGINPRISESNRDLHEYLVHNPDAFRDLSVNRIKDVPYIPNLEGHYRVHAQVAATLFPGTRFEEIAAVTELHFCTSAATKGLLESRRCTDRYFARVLQLITPTVVFAIGKHVADRLSARVGWPGGRAPVFKLPHPNDRLTGTARAAQIAAAINAARRHNPKRDRYERAT